MPVICFEGVDGVGKTTLMKETAKALISMGSKLLLTKEPGGPKALMMEWRESGMPYGKFYEGFRSLCVDNPQIPQVVKRALYRADSLYNWETVVKPNIDGLILSDRSWISDLAYGAVLTDFSLERLYAFNESLAPAQISNTYCVYVHCDEGIREDRLSKNTADAMDKLGSDIRNKICETYEEVFIRYLSSKQLVRVDSGQDKGSCVELTLDFIMGTVLKPC